MVVSGVIFAICGVIIFGCVMLDSPHASVLIGEITGFQITFVAVMVGLVAMVTFLLCMPTRRAWVFLKVSAGIASGLIVVGMAALLPLAADTRVTPILVDGCATGYVAVEPSGGGGSYVGVRDGIRVASVQKFAGDDFERPFAAGDYSTTHHGTHIDVTHAGDVHDPAFSLPVLDELSCR